MRRVAVLLVLVISLSTSIGPIRSGGGTVHYVDNVARCADLTPCHTTIMEAVDAAVPADIIEVFPGVYHETVVFSSKGQLVLRGHGGGAMPAIVAPAGANAVEIGLSPGIQLLGLILEAPDAIGVFGDGGGSKDAIIEGNLINARTGVSFRTGCFTARNNTIIGGIAVAGGSGCHVERNTVSGGIGFTDWQGGPRGNHVMNNVVVGGGIGFNGRPTVSNVAASNVVLDGGISVNGYFCKSNRILANVVRGGGIQTGFHAEENTIEGNFSSGSPGDGILVNLSFIGGDGGNNSILRNTSVENNGCDLNDTSDPWFPANHWEGNRYRTACGAAVPSAP